MNTLRYSFQFYGNKKENNNKHKNYNNKMVVKGKIMEIYSVFLYTHLAHAVGENIFYFQNVRLLTECPRLYLVLFHHLVILTVP